MNATACLVYTERKTKQVRWSDDSTRLAMVVTVTLGGQVVEIIQVMDFMPCGSKPIRVREFPTDPSSIRNYARNPYIESFGWDGDTLFALNIPALNDFGDFYLYNMANRSTKQVKPFLNLCCFRDFSWGPDNSYILFAFQNNNFGKDTQLFYIPFNTMGVNTSPLPLPIPTELLANPDAKPQPVLRPAQKVQP